MPAEGSEKSAEQQGPLIGDDGLKSSSAEGKPSLEGRSMWQRLKGIGRQQKNVSTLPCCLCSDIQILNFL